MSGRGKLTKSLSTGVIVLVFLLLIIQLVLFGVKIFQVYSEKKVVATAASAADSVGTKAFAAGKDTVSVSKERGSSNSGNRKVTDKNISRKDVTKSEPQKKVFALAPLPPKPAYKPKPKVDINAADTTELMTLYGIGSYFARRIVEFREQLGGSFASVEQLMDIKGIDSARFVGFESRICIDSASVRRIDFYTYPLDSLSLHPYIGKYAAKGIDRLRRTVPRSEFTISALVENEIISAPQAQRLSLYVK